jgi:predicted AAA+ superfamily ATPase
VDGLIPRYARGAIMNALSDTRVVLLLGARQVGKSTLVGEIASALGAARPVTLDDAITRAAAEDDPAGFVAALGRPAILDEVQRSPELLLAIKQAVDRDRSPGQFLLTGSANILTAPRLHEALAGRTEIIRLWPLSQGEIERSGGNLVDRLLAGDVPVVTGAAVGREAFVERAVAGGFPEAYWRASGRRERWFASYVESVVTRDVRELADVRRSAELPGLLRLVAGQAANLYRAEAMAKNLAISTKTVQTYTDLLETVYLVRRLRAWRPSIAGREVTTPKIYLVDSGLLAYLLGADETRARLDDQVTGKLFENFVAMELARLNDCARAPAAQYHYRDRSTGEEIDVIFESRAGAIVGVECKASATVRPADYRAMTRLRDQRSDRFVAGVVLYTGAETRALTDRIWALPVQALWSA